MKTWELQTIAEHSRKTVSVIAEYTTKEPPDFAEAKREGPRANA